MTLVAIFLSGALALFLLPRWAADMERVYGLAELIVAKQRHGATGKVVLKFDPTITRFSDYAGF